MLRVSVGLLLAGCAAPKTDRLPSADSAAPTYYSIERILRDLDTSLWVSGADLRPGLLSIHGRRQRVPTPDPPPSLSGFGFANGSTDNRRTIELSVTLRGIRIDIPQRHWADLYNLAFHDREAIRLGSCGSVDGISIGGSSGERGYSVIYFARDGHYLGRRISTLFQHHDDFSGGPERVSDNRYAPP